MEIIPKIQKYEKSICKETVQKFGQSDGYQNVDQSIIINRKKAKLLFRLVFKQYSISYSRLSAQ